MSDKQNPRSSKWAIIVYPDSAPKDWKSILKLSFVKFAVSPLHAPDQERSGAEQTNQRKEHWHVLLDFDSLKSFDQVLRIVHVTNGTIPVIVDNPSGYYQYMIHLNDPEKEQFPDGFDSIEKFNGFNGEKYEKYSEKQLDAIFTEICTIIDKQDIREYSTLVEYFMNPEHDLIAFVRIIRKNTLFFNTYISSRRNRIKQKEIIDINQRILKLEKEVHKNG